MTVNRVEKLARSTYRLEGVDAIDRVDGGVASRVFFAVFISAFSGWVWII